MNMLPVTVLSGFPGAFIRDYSSLGAVARESVLAE